ncbi:hypothetical protein [Alienimonas californiensis]|uniref:Uncharacterized protein n=1 Tax=Alienimonas californiensis TaxID=2527989 RepID=A0A517P716_9PLAN|nr:hypothetical protein [Alienimonas californiensis]QDT15164.1 hypothetical protein CA12_12450 [Alienimonas californiensis]
MPRSASDRSLLRGWAFAALALAPLTFSTLTLTGCSEDRGGETAPEEVEPDGQSEPPA